MKPPEKANFQFEKDVAALVQWRERNQRRVIANAKKFNERTWQLSLPKQNYTGHFINPLYGEFTVSTIDHEIMFDIGNLSAKATPCLEQDTMRVELVADNGRAIEYNLGTKNEVSSFTYDGKVFRRD